MTATVTPAPTASLLPAGFLALGTFAIGTEGFMIAPLLPNMATDFAMSVPQVALLVVVFTLTMALSAPFTATLTAGLSRRRVLLAAMTLFTVGNLLAVWSPSFGVLMAARVAMAVASGLYIPGANGLAGVIVPQHLRGRALAVVSAGQTLAIALGLPLGGLVGHAFGWRATFAAVGAMSLTAIIGILSGIDRDAGAGLGVATLRDRLAVLKAGTVLRFLAVSLFWSIGAYAAYPYIAPYLADVLGFGNEGVMAVVSLWGISAAAGVLTGGILNDRFGSPRVVGWSLALLGLSFLTLSVTALALRSIALPPVLFGVVLWGFTVWSFFPAQMSRLIGTVRPGEASLVLALNTSTMYLGFSIGSGLGALLLGTGAIWTIGALAALSELLALLIDRKAR